MSYVAVGGGLNTFVPSTNALATGALQVEFTRAVNTFPITKYAQIVPTQQMTGYYLRLDSDDNVRVTDVNEFAWPLGNDRPVGKMNQHDFVSFTAARYAYPFYIPNETVKQAAWDVVAQHARAKAQLAMTARSMRTATALTGSAAVTAFTAVGNYYASGSSISGGATGWTSSTTNVIQKGIQTALQRISLATGGAVRGETDIMMVISPTIANALSQTSEVRDYVKNYPAALPFLQGADTFAKYGLPPNLFGVQVVVDDSVKVTTRKGAASTTRSFVYGNSAVFVSRPGGLVGVEGSTSFSTSSPRASANGAASTGCTPASGADSTSARPASPTPSAKTAVRAGVRLMPSARTMSASRVPARTTSPNGVLLSSSQHAVTASTDTASTASR